MTHRTHHIPLEDRKIRTARQGSAAQALGEITPDYNAFILSYGQFSLIDVLATILDTTGPADVIISTWTAGIRDTEKAHWFVTSGLIRDLRFLVDRSFITRQPEYCAKMRRQFGDECIRTCRTHAKFMVISNEDWDIAVRTSMNLNENRQMENLEISNDPKLAGFLRQVADDIYAEHRPGDFQGELPRLASIPDVAPATVTAGTVTARRIYHGDR